MDNAQSLAILLATPAGVAVVGALLWWRVGNVEREVGKLREDKHTTNQTVAELKGSVEIMREVVTEFIGARGGRRKGD